MDASARDATIEAVVEGLARDGIAIVQDFLPDDDIAGLRDEMLRRDARGELAPAGVGRAASRIVDRDVRGDRIFWLDAGDPAPAEWSLHSALEALRSAANRELALGLWSYEIHYAHFPPGATYARHRDRFRDDDARVLSCIFYLNDGWRAEDGGALRVYFDDGIGRDVLPQAGTMVAFLSNRFEHEVLPSTRPRLAVSGWFRRRE